MEFKLPWREAGPLNHHDDIVDLDQWVFNKELSLSPGRARCEEFFMGELGACGYAGLMRGQRTAAGVGALSTLCGVTKGVGSE